MDRILSLLYAVCIAVMGLLHGCTGSQIASEAAKYNAALGQPTWQSSTTEAQSWSYPINFLISGNSSKAVDGDTNSDFKLDSCTHTDLVLPDNVSSVVWWSVDLGTLQRVQFVKLYNRKPSGERLQKFSIYGAESGHSPYNASGRTYCAFQDAPVEDGEAKDFECSEKVIARYIIVEKERLHNVHLDILTLCEAEVYVCRDENCAYCTEDRCVVCDGGYHLVDGLCTVKQLVCRDENCAYCTEDRCVVCDGGYHLVDGVCTVKQLVNGRSIVSPQYLSIAVVLCALIAVGIGVFIKLQNNAWVALSQFSKKTTQQVTCMKCT